MKIIDYLCLVIIFCGAAEGQNTNSPWRILFNGKNLSGFSVIGDKGKAWVEDSSIVCHQTVNTTEHTFVRTNEKFSNFILEADCLIEGEVHTGFLLRCIDATDDTSKVRLYGYQVKIDPTSRRWTGGVFDDYGLTWKWWYTLKDDERARSAFKLNEWNHFRMELIGPAIKVWVNGIPTTNMINDKYKEGYIALKIHFMGDTPEKEQILIRYKNIKIITKEPERYSTPMDIPAKQFE